MKTEYVIEVETTWKDKGVEGHLRQKYNEDEKEKAITDYNNIITNYNNENYDAVKTFFAPDPDNFYLRGVPKVYRLEINKVELDV